MHQALRRRYNKKVRRITEQRHGSDGRHSRQSKTYYCHNYKWKDHDHSNHCHNYDKHEKKQENKTSCDCGDKAFNPCSTHGPKSNHTFEECCKNPKNQDKCEAHNNKCQYEAHHNDALYTNDYDELRASVDVPVPSEDQASASIKDKNHEDENYHLHVDKKLKAGSLVPCKSDH
jgi:hypothetical protein